MGTRSIIGIERLDGTVVAVYCHWDGHISTNGKILHNSYTTIEQVEELISLGSISSLGKTIASTKDYHRWRDEEIDITYLSDRGDAHQQEYCYLFSVKTQDWNVKDHKKPWQSLADALEEEEE